MKRRKKKVRVERYAALLTRMEDKVDQRLQRWAAWLQLKSDRLSLRWKYILFIILCIGVSCICEMTIIYALK